LNRKAIKRKRARIVDLAVSGDVAASRAAFAGLLHKHLQKLGWTQSKLADGSGISEAQISVWRAAGSTRAIGRNHVNRIAWALASGYEENARRAGRSSVEVDSLETILSELLRAAGYAPTTGSPEGRIATLLGGSERSTLTVGWVPFPPFAIPGPSGPTGLVVKVTEYVTELMGVDIEWAKREWKELIPSLSGEERERIHLIAPVFLKLPTRMFRARFSNSLPGIFIGVNAVIGATYREKVVSNDPNKNHAVIDDKKLSVTLIRGEVGEALHRMIVPRAELETSVDKAEDACEYILTNPVDKASGRFRCFVADQVTCANLSSRFPGLQLMLTSPEVQRRVALPLSFAVLPEETKVVSVINSCLQIMEESRNFNSLLRDYKAELLTRGVDVSKYLEAQNHE
jgi:hypothetical protein